MLRVGEIQPWAFDRRSVCMRGQKVQRPASRKRAGVRVSEAASTKIRLEDMAIPACCNLGNCVKYIMPMPHITVPALAARACPTRLTAMAMASSKLAP